MLSTFNVSRYAVAAVVVVLAAIISPFGIEALTVRPDLSLRVTAVSGCLSVFLLLIGGGILSGGRARAVFLHVVFWTFPFALLACLEVAAIAAHLSSRIGAFEELSPLAAGNRYPNYLLGESRMYTRDGLTLYRPYEGNGIRINDLGLRTVPPTPKAAGEWRVAVTGGSAVWGWHVVDADTIVGQLQKIVSARGQSGVIVYNFGIEGATLQAEIALLKNFRESYHLDQVIFYTGANDAFSTYLSLFRSNWPRLGTFELVKVANRLMTKWLPLSPVALAHLDLTITDSLRQQNSLRSGMIEALAYCATAELRCDIAMQPMVFDLRKPVGSDREIEITVGRLFPRFDTLARKMYDEALAAVPAEHVRDFRDGTYDRSASPVFLDNVHTNELGYRIVAERIASTIPIGGAHLRSDIPSSISSGAAR